MKKYNQSAVLISALRYALGRRTYIVSCLTESISCKLTELDEKTNIVMIRDIEECKDYGMYCDKENWMDLLDELRK